MNQYRASQPSGRNLCTGSKDAHDIVNKYVTDIRGCVQMPGISAKENAQKLSEMKQKIGRGELLGSEKCS